MSFIISNSLIHGIIKALFIRRNMDFRDVVNNFINKNNDRQRQLSSLRSFLSGLPSAELFQKIYNCYMIITTTEITLYRFIGDNKPLSSLEFDTIDRVTFDCNQMMIKMKIKVFPNSKKFLFLICDNVRDFTKWLRMMPLVFKRVGIKIIVNGNQEEIGIYKGTKKKVLPLDVRRLEKLQDNADFVISDEEEGKIELFRRVNDRFNALNEVFEEA